MHDRRLNYGKLTFILFLPDYKSSALNKIAMKKFSPSDTTPNMFPKVRFSLDLVKRRFGRGFKPSLFEQFNTF